MNTLYLDNHLLVVDKPAGKLVQGDVTGDDDLLSEAKAYIKHKYDKPGNVYLGLVHRLDRPTSGVLVLARTSKAAARLSTQFKSRSTDKRYLAVLEGRLDPEGEATDGIVKREEGGVRIVRPDHPKAKPATLRWKTLAIDGGRALVEVELVTGRKHQIRAQLAKRGAPVLGDFRYGNPVKFADGRGIALHACRLTLQHPTKKERMTFTSSPPPSWSGLFKQAIARYMQEARRR